MAAPGAQAAPDISLALDLPGTVAVGQTNVAGSLQITATGDTPPLPLTGSKYIGTCNAAGNSTGCGLIGSPYDQGIVLTPSCAQTSGPTTTTPVCQVPDAGVFAISSTATGSGSGCSGTTFDVTSVDATLGMVRFAPRPSGARVLLGQPGSSCRIGFTFSVLKQPADANASTAGAQTRSFASAGAEYNASADPDVKRPAPLKAVAVRETTVTPTPCIPGQPDCPPPPPPPCIPGQPDCPPPPPPPCIPGQPDCPPPPPPPCIPGQPDCPPPLPPGCVPGQPPPPGVFCPSSIVVASMAGSPRCAAGKAPIKPPKLLGRPADRPFNVTVTVTQARTAVKSVEFFLNARKVKTLTKTNGGISRYVLRVVPSKMRRGSYRITARVSLKSTGGFTFTEGAPVLVRRITSPNIRVVPLANCRPDETTG